MAPGTKKQARGDGYLVVVGSSAGGIEALSVLVSTLRRDFPAPVVLAQHLDPTRASHLHSILERKSVLPVAIVTDAGHLQPGQVYVVPSNRHVMIEDGHLRLEADRGERPRPSVDLLLSTAARSYGDRLVAVILTGSGSDGAAGAVDVKDRGGVVVIQNPGTAAYPSMPLSLPPTVVDHVADLHEIGPLLHDLVSQAALPEAHAEGEKSVLGELLAGVTKRAGIDFTSYKATTILRRLARRMAVTHNRSLADYHQFLQAHPEEVGELVMTLLVKVTEFFRDQEAFSYLRREIVPELIARGRQRGRAVRVWSAGCATGEEAYSVAILLADALGGELPEWSVRIFATDLDEPAIAFARRGVYPANVLRNVPRGDLGRFFEPADQGYRVSKLLRQMVIFGQQDLSRGAPFPRIDLVICRNLLIYFRPQLQQDVLDVFAYSLHQTNGYLFLGKAETARPSRASYELANKKWKVYRCLKGPLPAAPRAHPADVLASTGRREAATPAPSGDGPELDVAHLRRLNEVALRHLGIGLVILDRGYRIVTINPAARRTLGIRASAAEMDFLHAARGLPYERVRGAIDAVFRERVPVTLADFGVAASAAEEPRYLTLTLAPVALEGSVEGVLVSVLDVTDLSQAHRRLEALQTEHKQLMEELGASNRRLTDTNKELQDANEELMLAQEELQATNEEFEATNEELQATNEELETNNEEMQATNEELETTNEELQARTAELQELNRVLTGERVRLSEMVELAPFYIVVLRGPSLLVDAMTPPSSGLFGGREALGLPFEDVCLGPALEPLLAGVREAFRRDRRWASGRLLTALPGSDDRGPRELVYSVAPSHDADGRVVGVVIYGEDVTEKRLVEEKERSQALRLMVEHAHPVALALYEADSETLVQASPPYLSFLERARGVAVDGAIGARFRDITVLTDDRAEAGRVFQAARSSGRPARYPEVRRVLADGTEVVWDWTLIPVAFGGGPPRDSVHYLLVCAFDVTDQVRLRDELRKVDHLKDEFLSLASHELRTPLVPLAAYADALERLASEAQRPGPHWSRRVQEVVGKSRGQVVQLSRLVDDLLDVARLRSGKFTLERARVDLRRVVKQAREQATALPDAPPIEVAADGGKPLVVFGDEQRLVQALGNLLSNAVRHAAGTPRVDVRLSAVTGDGGAPQVRIEVQDYGPGVPDAVRRVLFDPFVQGTARERPSRRGLGLGLFICRQIVEQHGGRVEVRTGRGTGSTFSLTLPTDATPRLPGRPGRPRGGSRARGGAGKRSSR
jgi:two-component system CheB/CheR fusion protein